MIKQINSKISTDYKMTELGPLPQEWKVVKLGEVVKNIVSGDWGNSEKSNVDFIKCYVLRGTDFKKCEDKIINDVPVRFVLKNSFEKRKLKVGDILIELSGGGPGQPTGRIFFVTDDFIKKIGEYVIFSNFVKKLIADKNVILPEYFYRYWQFLYQKGRTLVYEKRTTGIRNFKYNDFLKQENILIPKLQEQRKIAAILSTVQKAIETEGKLIERTKELKKAMMHKLFTEGIGWLSGAETSQKQTEIGPIPESWKVVKLGDYLLPNNDFRFSIDKDNFETACFIPMSLIPEENLFISKFEKRQVSGIRSGIVIYENDLLIAKITPCFENGKQGIVKGLVNGWGYATTEVIPIRTNEQINLIYIAYYFKYPKIRNYLASKMEGSTGRQRLPKSQIENLKIPLPPLPDQQAIADILSTIDQKIEFHSTKKQKLEELFRTFLHELMTARVRVDEINLDFIKMEE
ncbi:restriction endonuclease subunit S [hot springs metagenome]|uniref:Restriction endonuclease subunit S n=1 Tax=hot springs metagenome TaxID=433727 RepID=A0A5J4KZ55_9ZZZZ